MLKGRKASRITLKIECRCGHTMRVRVMDKGNYLNRWEIACQDHQRLHVKVVFGHIRVIGKPSNLDGLSELLKRTVLNLTPVIRTSDYTPFLYTLKFKGNK